MATELSEGDFAGVIGVPVAQLAALEREGLPVVTRAKEKRYAMPAAAHWFIEYSIARRVGGIPPRVNQQDLALLLGVVPRQVKNLVDAGKIPSVVEGPRRLYPLPQAVHEFVKYQRELAQGTKGATTDPLQAAKLRKLNAEAEQAEMALLRDRGELVERVLQQRTLGEIFQAVRSAIEQVPGRHDRKFVGLSSAAAARKVLRQVMKGDVLHRISAVVVTIGRQVQLVDETGEDPVQEADAEDAGDVGDAA